MKTSKLYSNFIYISIILFLSSHFVQSQPLTYPPDNSDCIRKDNINFQWTNNHNFVSYLVTVSAFADLSSPVISQPVLSKTNDTLSVTGNGAIYYWQVTGYRMNDPNIYTSAIGKFTTLKAPPVLESPANNVSCASKICIFQWQYILGASYTLQISTDNQFSSYLLNQSNISTNTYTYELPAYNSIYYWRVNASYSTCVTDYSGANKLTTQISPTSLASPADKANSQSTIGIRFKWGSIPGASTYTLQIATDSSFTSGSIFYEGIKNTNTDSVINFNASTLYYWRISADKSGCPVPWTAPYSFITGYAAPQNPKSKSDSCDPAKIALSWDNVSGSALYRLQVSIKPDFSTTVTDSQNLSINYIVYTIQKTNQRYYWRVKAADGINSGDWSTVSNFINNGGFPDRLFPANKSFNQPDIIVLKWIKPDISSQERIQIALDSAFNPALYDIQNITDDSLLIIMPSYNKTYYWKILSDYSCKVVWSNAWQFTTTLDKPQLVFPANNSTKQSQSITFQWLPTEGATTYEFSLSTDPLFQTQNIVKGVKGYSGVTFPVKNLSINTNYYWRVKASNSVASSAWSDIFKFRTGAAAPAIPNLTAPANGKQNLVITKVNLYWDSVPNAKYYWIQVSNKYDFSNKIKDIPDLTDTIYDLTGLSYNTTYYWRVLAISDSSQSDWSSVWSFTTAKQFPTDIAKLTTPAKNSEVSTANITFNWETVDRADYYDFQLSTDEKFPAGKFVVEDTTLMVNSRFVTGLQNYIQYFWRVRGRNTSGHAGWSETWNFSTLISNVDDILGIKYQINISPNPVTGLSTLSLNLPVESNVKIEIINLLGIKTDELLDNKLSQGEYSFIINSSKFENGLYYIVFTIDGTTITKKMIILR